MKIGRLVRALRLETQIPVDTSPKWRQKYVEALKLKDPKNNYQCASACFFIAVAGIKRYGSPIGDEVLLGIHRPYLSDADLKALSANQTIASTAQLRSIVEAYLKEMGAPSKYMDLMFSIPRDQIRWISEDDFKSDFAGFIPELKDWLDARCGNYTNDETRLDEVFRAKTRRGEKLTRKKNRSVSC